MSKFKVGDQVKWNYAGNEVKGHIVKRIEKSITLKGHKVNPKASDEPEYLVKTEHSKKEAVHRESALSKI